MAMPAEPSASLAASIRRSLAPLSQRSPNGVQPMPTIATRSRIPLLAIARSPCGGRVAAPRTFGAPVDPARSRGHGTSRRLEAEGQQGRGDLLDDTGHLGV